MKTAHLLSLSMVALTLLPDVMNAGELIKITAENEKAPVVVSGVPTTVLFFTAKWAGPARPLEPRIRALAEGPDIRVYWIDCDEAPELVKTYEVTKIPLTLVFDRTGKKVGEINGNKWEEVQRALLLTK